MRVLMVMTMMISWDWKNLILLLKYMNVIPIDGATCHPYLMELDVVNMLLHLLMILRFEIGFSNVKDEYPANERLYSQTWI